MPKRANEKSQGSRSSSEPCGRERAGSPWHLDRSGALGARLGQPLCQKVVLDTTSANLGLAASPDLVMWVPHAPHFHSQDKPAVHPQNGHWAPTTPGYLASFMRTSASRPSTTPGAKVDRVRCQPRGLLLGVWGEGRDFMDSRGPPEGDRDWWVPHSQRGQVARGTEPILVSDVLFPSPTGLWRKGPGGGGSQLNRSLASKTTDL